jgi:chromosome segregation protein
MILFTFSLLLSMIYSIQNNPRKQMYLEKLEVQGFKSFAHKNKLIFSGLIDKQKRGLTAIVGPNGSGKSNVADAVRWALGEQSLKTLRGKKSEDIIFSGSDQKSQLSLAEVSLYLNNAEALKNKADAPETIEKESDLDQLIASCGEIVITRRLYRSGESEYLLNNNRVRLADIQMLLAKANFGQKTYSVIGQGMVENFLSSSAADRKDFFDEATGVKQFQIKRDSALNKLENSYENLQQVDMLLSEIKPRLKSLTRQVEKLKRRGEIESELKGDQLNYYGYLWQDINKKLDSFNARFLESERLKLEREKKLDKLNEELNKIRNTDNFREINELTPRLKDLEARKNQYLKQLAKLQAELEVQLESQGQFDVSWLNNKQGELSAELENMNSEIAANEKNNSSKDETALNEELHFINQEIEKANDIRRKINQLNAEKDQYLRQISKLEAVLEANLEIQGQFDVSWLNNKNEELTKELDELSREIERLRSENNQAEKIDLENKLSAIQEKLGHLNAEIETINKELKKESTAGNQNEEISRVIDEFLKQLDTIGHESDLEKIKKMIASAKAEFKGKIQALISGGHGDDIQRIKDIQTEIISLTEERQEANNRLNDERLRLSSVNERLRLLEDKEKQTSREIIDIKAKLDKAQIKFDASKIENEKSEINKKIIILEKETTELAKNDRLAELNEKRQAALSKIQDYRLKASAIDERLRMLRAKKIQSEKEIEDIKTKISKSQIKFDASGIEVEKKEINEKLTGLNAEIKEIEDKLEELNREKDKEKTQMFECQKNIQALQAEVNDISDQLNGLKIEATRQETRLEDLEANIRGEELDISEIKDYRTAEAAIDVNLLQKRLSNNKNQLEQIGGIDPEAEKEYQETKERYDFLSGQVEDLDNAIKSLEEIIYELDLNIKDRFDAEFKVISEKFNEYFKILFSGGNAKISKVMTEDLEKEEAKNIPAAKAEISGLTPAEVEIKSQTDEKLKKIKFLKKHNAVGLAGIEIQATPPGKKIQTVTMLSGGERALTAIALICAIISANPSPFVVLDEVDAALDEANSERLASILDDLSNKTQFIVITHNRACMRKASILYGVTMEADGVSKLLSVKLDEINLAGR